MARRWLVRAAHWAVVGSLTWASSVAAAPGARKTPKKAPAPKAELPKPVDAPKEKAEDPEGPFAPKGKTGKLREATTPEPLTGPAEIAPMPDKPGAGGLDLVFGFGKNGTGDQALEFSVISFLLGGTYAVTPQLGVRLRIPFATGKVTGADAPSYNSSTFGNVELAGSYTLEMGESVKLPIELALAVPTGGGDAFAPSDDRASVRRYAVNTAARASRGLEEDALYSPHRLGIVPGVALRYRGGAIQTGAFTKVPVLIRAGGEDPPGSPPNTPNAVVATINPVVIEWIVGGDFRYAVYKDTIDVGARAWITLLTAEHFDTNLPGLVTPSKLQFVIEP
ncbi:MAG TPA: hypothetical protein VJT73_05085, partial [Polyangiaceae bacterium]|nr:hypothetical protein [Polyangiaceae bacterium]